MLLSIIAVHLAQMSTPAFTHRDLKLIEPSFGSSLTDLILELEGLRNRRLGGSTQPSVFFQLKHIFHMLESIGSARIEGNNTTVAEYIETSLNPPAKLPPSIREINNVEKAMRFVETYVIDRPINRTFIYEIHNMVVEGLLPPPDGEGDKTPGMHRKSNVKIAMSSHKPPDWNRVDEYMEELVAFINKKDASKYDLLKTAIAHHRFVWIHPFTNGNGRTVRLFTYAMLVRQGFNVDVGRIINPAAVFCSNRDAYYDHLEKADSGTDAGILEWCEYVLGGLSTEIKKIDRLLDYDYLQKEILLPTIHYALDRKQITDVESKVLRRVMEKQLIAAGDLKDLFPGKASPEVSRQIRRLIDKKMLAPQKAGLRKYVMRFDNNYLLRGIIQSLNEKGFLPVKD